MKSSSLLKFQIGPVQEFIAQARSTRDLWSGSYALSWLVTAGLNCLLQKGAEAGWGEAKLRHVVVFPKLDSQPLMCLRQPGLFKAPQPASPNVMNWERLTPSLTNLFLAQLPCDAGNAGELAKTVEAAIRAEWKTITDECGKGLLPSKFEERFAAQAASLLQISWQVTPVAGNTFAQALALNSRQLDAVRQVREFHGWHQHFPQTGDFNQKDSLTGREEQVAGGRDWWNATFNPTEPGTIVPQEWRTLFRERQASDYYGAITFTKRVWHLAYLGPKWNLHAGHRAENRTIDFPFPSTLHIASHDPAKNEEESPDEAPDASRYFAVLTMDGDEMGKWMSGDNFKEKLQQDVTAETLREFSAKLSTFGLKCARAIVEACDGRLIYSGGDDVVALLPADTVIPCARFLREAFRGQVGFLTDLKPLAGQLLAAHQGKAGQSNIQTTPGANCYYVSPHLMAASKGELFVPASDGNGLQLCEAGQRHKLELPGNVADVSTGIAIAHFKSPLQDVIREAQRAEKRAKNQLGRSAVAISLFKRSGETIEWGCKWDGGGLELYRAIADALEAKHLSGRFPYRAAELLQPYLTEISQLTKERQSFVAVDGFDKDVVTIIRCEFGVALGQQNPLQGDAKKALVDTITAKLDTYLKHVDERFMDALKVFEKRHSEGQAKPWDRPRKPDFICRALIGLCQTVAFIERNQSDDERETPSLKPEPQTTAERQS